jgi:hypothetical protein
MGPVNLALTAELEMGSRGHMVSRFSFKFKNWIAMIFLDISVQCSQVGKVEKVRYPTAV